MKYEIEWTRRGEDYETGPLLIAGEVKPRVRITRVSQRTHRTPEGFRTFATWRIEWDGATTTKPSLRDAKDHVQQMVDALMRKGRAA